MPRRTTTLLALSLALVPPAACAKSKTFDLSPYGVQATVQAPRGVELRQGHGGAMIVFQGSKKVGAEYALSVVPSGGDADLDTWATTMPSSKREVTILERSERSDGWLLTWREVHAEYGARYRLALYHQGLDLICATASDPETEEGLRAAVAICESLEG